LDLTPFTHGRLAANFATREEKLECNVSSS